VAAHEAGRARSRQDAARIARRCSRATSRRAPVAKTQSNLRAAQVDGFVRVEQADFLLAPAPAPPASSCQSALRRAPRRPGSSRQALPADRRRAEAALRGWTAYFFTGDLRLPKLIISRSTRRTPLMNGAIDCRLFEFPDGQRSPGKIPSSTAPSNRPCPIASSPQLHVHHTQFMQEA
jgi:23S rRNA G2445 N2-methylase RlmL